MKKLLIGMVLVLAPWAMAQSAKEIQSQIDDGKFLQAYNAASKSADSELQTLAAQAASFYATYQAKDEDRADYFGKAETAANKAISTNKNNPDAYFELVRAQGRLSQYRGILDSLNLANSIKAAAESALKLRPKFASAKIAQALWNHSLASKGVAWLFGADDGRTEGLFREAITLEPNVIIHRVEFASVLAEWNRKDEAIKMYQSALDIKPKTAADRYDLERTKKALSELK